MCDIFILLGNFYRTLSDDNVLRTLVEFLTYLHLKGKTFILVT